MIHDISSINIIGSGRVAGKLTAIFLKNGIKINGIHSRNFHTGQLLAESCDIEFYKSLEQLPKADLTLIAVNDDEIEKLSGLSPANISLLVHTSGSVPLIALKFSGPKGVFYPLQTFTSGAEPNWKELPVCVEAEKEEDLEKLKNLAYRVSDKVFSINSEQRKSLHLAAVFANNFVNHLLSISEDILSNAGIEREILHPLILETITKVQHGPAKKFQTGPAMRSDKKTIEKHINLLQFNPGYAEIYDVITKNIMQLHGKKL